MGGLSWDIDYVLFQPVQPRSAGVSAKVPPIVTSRKNLKVILNYYLFRASFHHLNSLNFRVRALGLRENKRGAKKAFFRALSCAKIDGCAK